MVTGLGGIFIKADDPKYMARWYEDNLGIGFGTHVYFSFKWRDAQDTSQVCLTDFSLFKSDTDYFFPSTSDSMVNFRVADLDEMRIRLQKAGAQVIEKVETYEYGRFGWVMDPIGNKIELWEPVDSAFPDIKKPMQLSGAITGLGGFFIKCPDPESIMQWYASHLGLFFSYSSHTFRWNDLTEKTRTGHTVFAFFPDSSKYFSPSVKTFMLNFRVNNLDELLASLRSSGVQVMEKTEVFEYGKFGWCIDPEGNKIELWEPVDERLTY